MMFPSPIPGVLPPGSGASGHHGHGHSGYGVRREGSVGKSLSSPALSSTPLPQFTTAVPVGMGSTRQPQQPIREATGSAEPQSALWGELEIGGQSVAHKQPMRPLWHEGWKATSVMCSVPRLYQLPPSLPTASVGETTASVSSMLDHPRDSQGHNLALHCIDMQHHLQELRHMISVAPSRQEMRPGSDPLMNAPPMPSRFWKPDSKEQPANLLEPPSCKLPPVQLDQTALYLLLRKSAAAVCAQAGYESSSSRALDTLTDVLGDFLSKTCKLLRINADQQAESRANGFQDVLDQSLHQCGIGGKAALHRYWQGSVRGCASRLQQVASENHEEYQRLTEPPGGRQGSTSVKSSTSVPTSLPLSKPGKRDPIDFRLPSPWPLITPDVGGGAEEEIPLETVMQQADLDNVALTRTPDLGAAVMFSQFSAQETEGFAPLTLDGPPRKRLKTMSLSTD